MKNKCEHRYEWNDFCGAYVCEYCLDHKNLSGASMVGCFCGWNYHKIRDEAERGA